MAVRDVVQAAAGVGGGDKLYVEDVFSTYLFTGTGTTTAITNGIDLDGEGGLVWIKDRDSGAKGHALFDTERGGQYKLQTQWTGAQTSYNNIVFNSDGFTNDSLGDNNGSGTTFASWTFRKKPKFFDVVTWTGDDTTNRTHAHNLGSVPGLIIVKATSRTSNWTCYHRSLGNTQGLSLNSTDAAYSTTAWNSTSPTDSVFTATSGTVNEGGQTYVAYLFAHDAGGFGDDGLQNVISCGSYTGTGSEVEVDLGWEPQWILTRRSDDPDDWYMVDTMRGIVTSGNDVYLRANLSSVEGAGVDIFDVTATGFRTKVGARHTNGGTYIYIAIRRPMKTPESGTEVFAPVARSGTGSQATVTSAGFPPDLVAVKSSSITYGNRWTDRLRGAGYALSTDTSDSELNNTTIGVIGLDVMNGATYGAGNPYNNTPETYINWFFRRAPGFFDVVAYTGNGTAGRTVAHNLGVVPEFMIVKARNDPYFWVVYDATNGPTKQMLLNYPNASQTYSAGWNNTAPTASVFTTSYDAAAVERSTNRSATNYIAYLFASLPNVSKIGSYTGTGTTQTINCGFSSGARFVLIKRTDSTGDWYVWDSARGIVAGNDPYLLLNTVDAEVTSTDYIDPVASGFEISSSAPAEINASGGTFIFLAIA